MEIENEKSHPKIYYNPSYRNPGILTVRERETSSSLFPLVKTSPAKRIGRAKPRNAQGTTPSALSLGYQQLYR
jgi:hypothetical protein